MTGDPSIRSLTIRVQQDDLTRNQDLVKLELLDPQKRVVFRVNASPNELGTVTVNLGPHATGLSAEFAAVIANSRSVRVSDARTKTCIQPGTAILRHVA